MLPVFGSSRREGDFSPSSSAVGCKVRGPFPPRSARVGPAAGVLPSVRALDAAIDAATFFHREPTEDGERIVVFCNAPGGSFIHSRQEVERRIMLNFPGLALDEVAAATRFLKDRVAAFMKPIQADTRHKSSWIYGWRYDH